MPLPKLSFVTGGARSGKSALAERLTRLGAAPHHYIATAEPWDDEMRERIARHRADRGAGWITHEAPLDLPAALSAARGTVLIDCATLWLTNQMLGGHDLEAATQGLLAALHKAPGAVVIVSNEVGWGIVPENALARAFRDAQGRLNQRLAAQADLAIAVIAGLPMVLKGQMPEGAA
ncbi:bifunctional adenosylcobinamide kinase/adenosylcobinamide-phosphate guanylyltransferase [Gemmobacter nectariphilus]|uniref:bifunctional adenosylcobinamide kinase/adenosylcobinamide-phosphate guanylyltransferase n=1 Tax=Gemmobacter nectariphilus TaxID=220343 RepID=UPI000426D141|nr:bifunctional adenosylcobinamide kinase/adenosylcobinamide-phosphate guanylyltransferase [Gemmobacter nectariphilus]